MEACSSEKQNIAGVLRYVSTNSFILSTFFINFLRAISIIYSEDFNLITQLSILSIVSLVAVMVLCSKNVVKQLFMMNIRRCFINALGTFFELFFRINNNSASSSLNDDFMDIS